jgi:uncharacterized protein YgbK (DUF1537 family)
MTRLGCIADDYTGAADVASVLRRAGLRTMLRFGTPDGRGRSAGTTSGAVDRSDADAVVVALKSRNAAASEAVRASLAARRWLGTERLYFKYCSTFDSTDAGNIGPVADALLDAAGSALTVVCPASPEHGRTVYQGHLFVGDRLLAESPMRHHPLNPMTESDLVRVLARQTRYPVALVPHEIVREGPDALASALNVRAARGIRYAVTDGICDADLATIAAATRNLPLQTGAAGLAHAIGKLMGLGAPHERPFLPDGPTVILAGSCSPATLSQVAHATGHFPALRLDPLKPDRATAWLDQHLGATPILIYSSVPPGQRTADHGPLVERAMGRLAERAVHRGARRFVIAGGETAGAVVEALAVDAAVVGDEVDSGVPWLVTTGIRPIALLLKSGNFGAPDLLVRAAERCTAEERCSPS